MAVKTNGTEMVNDEELSTACILEPGKDEPFFVDIPEGMNAEDFMGFNVYYTYLLPPLNGYVMMYDNGQDARQEDKYNLFYLDKIYYGKVALIKIEESDDGSSAVAHLSDEDKMMLISNTFKMKHDPINKLLKEALKDYTPDTLDGLLDAQSKILRSPKGQEETIKALEEHLNKKKDDNEEHTED